MQGIAYYLNLPVFWGVMGIILAVFEMLVPGVYLLWLGAGSLTVGATLLFFPLSLQSIMIVFTVSSILFMILGAYVYRHTNSSKQGDNALNRRGASLIGATLILEDDIKSGKGRVRIGDSLWPVKGPDLPAGTKIVVESIEGNHLLVKEVK